MYSPISGLFQEKQLEGLNWDLSTYPTLNESPGVGAQPYPTFMSVASVSKYKDEAFEVVNYLTSEPFLLKRTKEATFLPLLSSQNVRDAFGQDAPMYKGKNTKAIIPAKKAAPSPLSKYYSDAGIQLGTDAVSRIVIEGKDINTSLREGEEAIAAKVAADRQTSK
jgi:multiple sugar transport system substrate-binding protein